MTRDAVGVSSYTENMSGVADRRRLGCWAASRGIRINNSSPESCDVVVVNPLSDLSQWANWRESAKQRRLVFDFVDFRYVEEGFRSSSSPALAMKSAGRNLLYGSGSARLPWPSYGDRIKRILLRADRVTCATPEHAAFLDRHGIRATPILDCQEEIPAYSPRRIPAAPRSESPRKLNILWEGQLATLGFMRELHDGIAALCARASVRLTICTETEGFRYANRFARVTPQMILRSLEDIAGLTIVVVPWDPSRLADEALSADVAVLPVSPRDRTSWLKPENRAVIMWRLGLPVLMSGTPAFRRAAMAAGAAGIVDNPADWVDVLSAALDGAWRREQAERGHKYAVVEVAPEVIHRQWDNVLGSL